MPVLPETLALRVTGTATLALERVEAVRVRAGQAPPPWWRALRLDPAGLAVAGLFVCFSLTPSLLPRSPVFQGWLSGIVAAAGYGIGTLNHAAGARVVRRRPPPWLRQAFWVLLLVVMPVTVGVFLVAARRWQHEAHLLVGQRPPGPGSPVFILALALLAFAGLVATGRGIRRANRALHTVLCRRLPVALAAVASVAVVVTGAGLLFVQVVMRAAFLALDRAASAANDVTPAGIDPPERATRSGGPGSVVAWDDLGYQGRRFVTGGATHAKDPVRVYVGVLSAATAADRADLAVAELERTGAFGRAVVCVVLTTGTGWVDPEAAGSLEDLYDGDTAIVSTQYSYLPSPVSFVFDDDQVETEGATLVARVAERIAAIPAAERPKLLLYGESLGSNGAQAALVDPRTAGRVDAALLVGAPRSNRLRDDVTHLRDAGSPERLPEIAARPGVRFAAAPEDLPPAGEDGTEEDRTTPPQVLFLQHASDPVVWWTPDLLFQRPDWLEEERGSGVSSSASWFPVVTFFQVTADLVAANDVPLGAGHRYGDLIGAAWAAVAPPAG